MSDWRQRVSGPALDDFEALMGSVLPSAESALKRFGQLQAFGATITTEGDLVRLSANPLLGRNPQAGDVVRGIYSSARASAFARRAIAVVQAGRSSGSTAIRIDMEHENGQCLTVVVPFSISRFKKRYLRGAMMAGPCERQVWNDQLAAIDLRTAPEVAISDVWSNEPSKG